MAALASSRYSARAATRVRPQSTCAKAGRVRPLGLALLVLAGLTLPARAAVECRSSQGSTKDWWSWRMIDGRKCWYPGKPGMDKALLSWGSDDAAEAATPPFARRDPVPSAALPMAPVAPPALALRRQPIQVAEPEPPPPPPAARPAAPVITAERPPIIEHRRIVRTSREVDSGAPQAAVPQPAAPEIVATVRRPGMRQFVITALLTSIGLCLIGLALLMRPDQNRRWSDPRLVRWRV
ncbi:MAG: hypothetical protein ACJ8F3_18880 [Xanthobacteraceae bacterium]